ncbi:protein of unknown function [Stenotrophomonas maltophilia]|nr:protein of unknown function [Stenotrophomonas maltophilia]
MLRRTAKPVPRPANETKNLWPPSRKTRPNRSSNSNDRGNYHASHNLFFHRTHWHPPFRVEFYQFLGLSPLASGVCGARVCARTWAGEAPTKIAFAFAFVAFASALIFVRAAFVTAKSFMGPDTLARGR